MEDNSSITALTNQNLNFEDECRITLARFNKSVNGREIRYIRAQAMLLDDEVDEAHDLFYLVKMPEASYTGTTSQPQLAAEESQMKFGIQLPERGGVESNQQPPPRQMLINSHSEVSNALKSLRGQQQTQQQQLQSAPLARQTSMGSVMKAASGHFGGVSNNFINQHTGSFTFHPQTNSSACDVISCADDLVQLNHGPNKSGVASQGRLESATNRSDHDTIQHLDHDPIAVEILRRSPIKKGATERQRRDSYGNSSTSSLISPDKLNMQAVAKMARMAAPKLPKTYGDLTAEYTVAVKRDKKNGFQNVAIGQFPLSKVPDGKYRIYYFRPKNRNRILGRNSTSSSAQDKIQRVGRGQEFYIFDKNSSESPSKQYSNASYSQQSFSMLSSKVADRENDPNQQQQQQQLTVFHATRHAAGICSGMPHKPFPESAERSFEEEAKSRTSHLRHQSQFLQSQQQHQQLSKQGTPSQNITYCGKDVSPEEIDQLICQYSSKESIRSGPQSKDSILTERVKQDNLAQNFPFAATTSSMNINNVIKVESHASQSSSSPDRDTQSRIGFFTFGQNSIADIRAGNTETLANLQEIYSAHQNLGVQIEEETGQSQHSQHSQHSTLDQPTPDTPNLYQTMSLASQHGDVSVADRSTNSYGGEAPSRNKEGTGPKTKYPQPQHQSNPIVELKPRSHGGKFALHLKSTQPPRPTAAEIFSERKPSQGAAIRVERQDSSQNGSVTNSSSSGVGHTPCQNQQLDESNNAQSAFAAAESELRKSQIEMYDIEAAAAAQNDDADNENNGMDGGSSDPYLIKTTQPEEEPMDIPAKNQDLDTFINEIMLTPELLEYHRNHFRTSTEEQQVKNGVEMEKAGHISFLQQLLDTRGPIESNCSINVIQQQPIGNGLDQPIIRSNNVHKFAGLSQAQTKHSRAIAFYDNSLPPQQQQQQTQQIPQEDFQLEQNGPTTAVFESDVETDFDSPNKAQYRELIEQANFQNNPSASFDQLTRNNNGGGSNDDNQKLLNTLNGNHLANSDRKQLSTVEEENASQCSDFQSFQQNHSKFLQNQQVSGKSRKSMRSSMQLQGNQSKNCIQKFCISEENSETDVADSQQQHPDNIFTPEDSTSTQQAAVQLGVIQVECPIKMALASHHFQNLNQSNPHNSTGHETGTVNETGAVEKSYTDEAEDRVKNHVFSGHLSGSGNFSGMSTKTCSKQPSDTLLCPQTQAIQKESQLISGISNLRIESKTNQRVELQNSDYYNMKTSSSPVNEEHHGQESQVQTTQGEEERVAVVSPVGGEPGTHHNYEDSSSSLRDLENNDHFYLSGSNKIGQSTIAGGYQNKRNLARQAELKKQLKILDLQAMSAYQISRRQGVEADVADDDTLDQEVGNFKKVAQRSSGERCNLSSQDSGESLDSVKLSCSEKLHESTEEKQEESAALLDFMQKMPNPEDIGGQSSIYTNKTLSPVKQPSMKTAKVKAPSHRSKRSIGFKKNISIYKDQISNDSYKENSSRLIGSPHSSSYMASSSGAKSKTSQQQLQKPQAQTPYLRQTKNYPLKLHQLIQKQSVCSPQLLSNSRKKFDLISVSEKKLVFNSLATNTGLLSTHGGSLGSGQVPPPQPLLKQKNIFSSSKKASVVFRGGGVGKRPAHTTGALKKPSNSQASLHKQQQPQGQPRQ